MSDHLTDPVADGWGTLPHGGSGTADDGHANGNGFAVRDGEIGARLDGVSCRMSEIEKLAQTRDDKDYDKVAYPRTISLRGKK